MSKEEFIHLLYDEGYIEVKRKRDALWIVLSLCVMLTS